MTYTTYAPLLLASSANFSASTIVTELAGGGLLETVVPGLLVAKLVFGEYSGGSPSESNGAADIFALKQEFWLKLFQQRFNEQKSEMT
jgi:hypothetical protein